MSTALCRLGKIPDRRKLKTVRTVKACNMKERLNEWLMNAYECDLLTFGICNNMCKGLGENTHTSPRYLVQNSCCRANVVPEPKPQIGQLQSYTTSHNTWKEIEMFCSGLLCPSFWSCAVIIAHHCQSNQTKRIHESRTSFPWGTKTVGDLDLLNFQSVECWLCGYSSQVLAAIGTRMMHEVGQ